MTIENFDSEQTKDSLRSYMTTVTRDDIEAYFKWLRDAKEEDPDYGGISMREAMLSGPIDAVGDFLRDVIPAIDPTDVDDLIAHTLSALTIGYDLRGFVEQRKRLVN